jgi:hypothetical protein
MDTLKQKERWSDGQTDIEIETDRQTHKESERETDINKERKK